MAVNNPDAIQYKIVNILTMGLDSSFERPDVRPRCAELRLKANEQIVWVTVPPGVEFTLRFKGESPFERTEFNNEYNISGPPVVKPDGKDKFYAYSLEVEGHIIDPGIIFWE